MANKMVNCKHCGAPIASSAKVCPSCGAKNKQPIYKKWWFYLIIAVVAIGIIGGNGGNQSASKSQSTASKTAQEESKDNTAGQEETQQSATEEIEYEVHDVTELFDALNGNAMKAQDTYKGTYVELHGYLGTIDSNGKYFGLGAEENNYDYLLQTVQCFIRSDEQKQILMEKNKNDPVVVRGQITDVGEVLGYSLEIDSIE